VKVVKNKVAPPFKNVEFDILFGKGISQAGDLLDCAVLKNIVSKSGTYFNYGETRLGQGRDNARTFLEENQAVFDQLLAEVRGSMMAAPAPKAAAVVIPDIPIEPEELG
jgi:recombination protein RecA